MIGPRYHRLDPSKLRRLIKREQYTRTRKSIDIRWRHEYPRMLALPINGFSVIGSRRMWAVVVCVLLVATFAMRVTGNEETNFVAFGNETLLGLHDYMTDDIETLDDNMTTMRIPSSTVPFVAVNSNERWDVAATTDKSTTIDHEHLIPTKPPDSDKILQMWIDRGYDPEYNNANKFWLTFEPPSHFTYRVFSVIYCVITVFGCFGNAFVIYMFMRFKTLRIPANMLVLNLSISDFIMLAKCPIAIYNNFHEGPALGYNACVLYGFIGGLSGTATILTLTAIALDRYYVVVHPLTRRRNPNQLQHICIPFIWLYSLLFAAIPALNIGLSSYTPEGYLSTCSFDYLDQGTGARIFMFVFFVAAWVVPLFIICHSYFYILKVVFEARRIQSNRNTNKTEQKLAIIVFLIIGVWFVAWTPYTIVALSGIFGQEQYLSPTISMIPALFCKLAACIDPYIYAVSHSRFRQEFRRLFSSKRGKQRRGSGTRSTMTRSSMMRRMRSNSTDTDFKERLNEFLPTLPAVREISEQETIAVISGSSLSKCAGLSVVDLELDSETPSAGAPIDMPNAEERPKCMETSF